MRNILIAAALGTAMTLASGPTANPAQAAGPLLITETEAGMGPYQGMTMMTRAGGGPIIKVLRPDQVDGGPVPVLSKPVHISLQFEPVSQAKVDMASLKVIYLKLFGIDITDRLKPYVAGEAIDVPEADIPTGDHSIRVDIKDTSGKQSSQTFRFVVK
jgi:hypothetical protein